LRLNSKGELHNLGMVDFVQIVLIVVVVDGVYCINQFLQVTIKEIDLESRQNIEV
jgi:hypothetical protein